MVELHSYQGVIPADVQSGGHWPPFFCLKSLTGSSPAFALGFPYGLTLTLSRQPSQDAWPGTDKKKSAN